MSALTTIENRQQALELEVKAFELEQRRAGAFNTFVFRYSSATVGFIADNLIASDLYVSKNSL